MVQGLLELPPAIMELSDTIYEVYNLIDEYGIKVVADGILESMIVNSKYNVHMVKEHICVHCL